MNWYKRYMGDYARDTADLTMTQDGAYTRLLDRYYTSGRPLPEDKAALYRITRAFERYEREAVDSVLAKFFKLTPGGYIQARAERELAKYKKAADTHTANLGRKMDSQNAPEKPEARYQIKEKPKISGAQNAPKRATPFPEGFALNENRMLIAQSWGITNPSDEWTHFESHHIAKGSRFVNWDRAWVTWCIRSRKMNPRISDDAVRREAMAGSRR